MPEIDTILAAQTAFDNISALRAHIADGGKAPSFRADKPEALALALALQGMGIPATIWT